ncbi:MAG: hypothetical protein HOP11_13045 [Saprospiraceae bacterium]|nr:hypothetical protein [Saprospiraceae bacterium]
MSYFLISNLPVASPNHAIEQIQTFNSSNYNITLTGKGTFNSYRKEDESTILIILGNPIFKNNFNSLIQNISISELALHPENIFEIFNQINGICGILVIHKKNNSILIATDPLGYFPIFIYESDESLVITSELKQLWNSLSEHPELDTNAILEYYNNGHFISGKTWYKNCHKVLPSTFLILNTTTGTYSQSFYWTWKKVIRSENANEKKKTEYYNSFIELFKAIDLSSQKIGVGLSGGLDSRWVAYELQKSKAQLSSYTLSQNNSIEQSTAKKISSILKIKHHTFPLSFENWFEKRLYQFWSVDGLIPIHQFHEGPIYNELNDHYDMIATGFYGGGIYASETECNQKINSQIANRFLSFLTSPPYTELEHFSINCIDPYLSWQKISNLGALQVYTMSKSIPVLLPFYNMNWMQVNYSIDDRDQIYSKFFLEVLNDNLPKEINSFIWQRTLLPSKFQKLNFLIQKFQLNKVLKLILQKFGMNIQFVKYDNLQDKMNEIITNESKPEFLENIKPITIENKFRYISILLWLKMNKERSHNVL